MLLTGVWFCTTVLLVIDFDFYTAKLSFSAVCINRAKPLFSIYRFSGILCKGIAALLFAV